MHRNNKLGYYIVGKVIVSYLLLRNYIVDRLLVISAVRLLFCKRFFIFANLLAKLYNLSYAARV